VHLYEVPAYAVDERKSDDSRGEPGKPRGKYARIGRRVASMFAVAAVAYFIIVGIVSVIPQVFWPERAAIDPSVTCEAGVRDLRAELLARASDHIASGGSEDRTWMETWLEDFDRRHLGLEGRCSGEGHEAWSLVGRMRERVQSTLVRFDDEEGALAREADERLARLAR
jgi:hypothetical protein